MLETQYDTYSNRIGFIPKFLESKATQSVISQMQMMQDLEKNSNSEIDSCDLQILATDLEEAHQRLISKRNVICKKSKQVEEKLAKEELAEEEQALSLILACVDSWTRKTNSLKLDLRTSDLSKQSTQHQEHTSKSINTHNLISSDEVNLSIILSFIHSFIH